VNCAIGQRDRCSKDGCSWFKVFGYHCKDRDLHPKDVFLYVKKFPKLTKPNQTKRKMIYETTDGICYLCGKHVSFDEMTVDHVIPTSKGGGNNLGNLRPTHRKCNLIKGDKILIKK
jgi:5-methylcytosine-specific restriction endonuclease McrA